MERIDFSYENTYEFEQEVGNPYNGDEVEIIVGDVTFYADAEWNESLEWYEITFINWTETSGRFSTDGDAPGGYDLEWKFMQDFREYLISQGVDRDDIEYYEE